MGIDPFDTHDGALQKHGQVGVELGTKGVMRVEAPGSEGNNQQR